MAGSSTASEELGAEFTLPAIPRYASVIIATKNRKDELRQALRSAVDQTARAEVIVVDDGSTDGTSEMVSAEFPEARLIRHQDSRGYIVRRNEGARLATGEIVFSIDDDAEFSTPKVIEQALGDFDDPRIGVVAMPYVEPKKTLKLMQVPPDAVGTWITGTFIGTAHALRRELFLALGGYREALVHQGEEGDLSIRLLETGHVVRLGRSDAIVHWESPKRDFRRMDFFGTRNSIFFQWQNAPFGALLPGLMVTTLNCLRWTLNPARVGVRIQGLWAGYRMCGQIARRPVRAGVYRLWRHLRKTEPMRLADVVRELSFVPTSAAK